MHADVLYVLTYLNTIIPHKNWFIAGGCAASDNFTDIDVYFHSMQDYNAACQQTTHATYNSANAVSFNIEQSHPYDMRKIPVQYIKRHVGDHVSVVETFDLNKSRYVIFPDGSTYAHPSTSELLNFTLSSMNRDTLSRFGKYINNKHFTPHPDLVPLVASLLATDLLEVDDYYEDTQLKVKVVPISQVEHYNYSDITMHFIIDAINLLQPTDRINKFTYLFQRWQFKRPPISDTSSTEFLYAHHRVYSTPIHPRVIAENPEYLI